MHRRLLGLTGDSRLPFLLTILSGFAAGLLTIWQAWLLSMVIDRVFLGSQSLSEVLHLLVWMLVAIGARALLTWLNEVASNELAVQIKTGLRERLLGHLFRLGPAHARGQRTGELTSTLVDGIEALDAYFSQYLPQLVVTALIPISILIVVFQIDLLSGFILLITAPLIPFFMIMIGKGAEAVNHRQFETLRLLSAHFLDSLQGLTTLKIFGQSRAQARTIAQVNERFRDMTMSVLRVTFLSALVLELLASLSTAVIAVEIGFRLLYARMDFQPALFLLVLAPEFYMPLRALGARFHAGMAGTTAARQIYEVLDTAVDEHMVGRKASAISGLKLKDVSYRYPTEVKLALESIDLGIRAGEHIALVGKTGAGKSTLANLLLGFISPTSGKIERSAPSIDQIAWVSQKPYLFHDTIAANIALGRENVTHEQLVQAALAAHLDEFIESLPQKYETVIGEGGARLSDGQAQRLALARAFLKDAPMLILDEPTSSLDPETESLLEASMHRLMQGRTVITIAHRLNTIFQADQIVVLDNGSIVEQGTHRELLEKSGTYASMVNVDQYDQIEIKVKGQKSRVQSDVLPSTFDPVPLNFQTNRTSLLIRLLSFLKGSWSRVVLSVLISAGTIGSSIALVGTSAWLISTAALHPSVAELGVSVVAVRFFGISRGVLRYVERLVSHDVTLRLLAGIRTWFYERLEPLAPARLMQFRAGDLLARIVGDVSTLEDFYIRVISPPLTALAVGLFTALFLASFDPVLALIFLMFFTFIGLALPLISQLLSRSAAAKVVQLRAELSAQLVEGIQGMAELLIHDQKGKHRKRISKNGAEYGNAQRRLARITGFHAALGTLLTNLGMWTVLFVSIPRMIEGELPGPMLASLALLVFASFEAVTPLSQAAQSWNSSVQAGRRLFEIVDTEPAVQDGTSSSSHGPQGSGIQFSDVTFSYPGEPIAAIQNISFTLEEGQSIAIVGPSGAGKSTIANLLLRFWEYDSGGIRLGGESLRTIAQDQVRARISFISRNTYFFNTSLRENLRFARRGVIDAEIETAARSAQIHDFIMSLPKGYDTIIGEHGLRLSGGERQRLSIARALIKNAPVLILDEPTANLDPLTEKQVLGTLFEVMKNKTSILVTHRLIGLENMDEILVMDQGHVIERGSHAALVKMDGLYHHMLALQNRILNAEI